MYLLYYVAISTVKKREMRKRSDNVLVKLCSHWYCKERKKGGKNTGTVVRVEGYDPVNMTIVYILALLFFVSVYWKRVKVLYLLVVTSLEGLQWWSLIISLNVQSNRKISVVRTNKNWEMASVLTKFDYW